VIRRQADPACEPHGVDHGIARALLAAEAGEHERGLEDARAAVAVADTTRLIICRADAHRTLADLLLVTGSRDAAASHARRALALDEAKANTAAATATRQRFSRLLGSSGTHPGVQTQEGVKSSSYTDD
jgi:hypothetical protein